MRFFSKNNSNDIKNERSLDRVNRSYFFSTKEFSYNASLNTEYKNTLADSIWSVNRRNIWFP